MFTNPNPTGNETHVISSKRIMCKTDINGFIEYANEYFVELSGYTEGEIIGENLRIISHPKMPKTITKYIWDKITKKQKAAAIIKYLSKSGNHYWLEIKLDYKVNEYNREILNIYLYANNASRSSVLKLEEFYNKLYKIEDEAGLEVAENYFSSYLENLNTNYEDFITNYLNY
jgi:PAS domain S-box-containing protein